MHQWFRIWFMIQYIMCFVSCPTYYEIEGFRKNICLTCYFVLAWPILGTRYEACIMSVYNCAVFCSAHLLWGKYNTQLECTRVLLRLK